MRHAVFGVSQPRRPRTSREAREKSERWPTFSCWRGLRAPPLLLLRSLPSGRQRQATRGSENGLRRQAGQKRGTLIETTWNGSQWVPGFLRDRIPALRPPGQPDAEVTLSGDVLWYISGDGRPVLADLVRNRVSHLPRPASPFPGQVVAVEHLSPAQMASNDTLVGSGSDGQLYWWERSGEGVWRGFSLLARTGWPQGWTYVPQLGRTS